MTPREWARGWIAEAKRQGVGELRGQRSGKGTRTIAGKSIIRVMGAYATFAGGGDAHPSQAAIAKRANVGKRTVEAVQDWLIENDWLTVTSAAIPGVRGPQVRLHLPREPAASAGAPIHGKEVATTTTTIPRREPRVTEQKAKRVCRGYVMVHRAGSNDPNDFVPVPVSPSVGAYLARAEGAARERDADERAEVERRAATQRRVDERLADIYRPGSPWVSEAHRVIADTTVPDHVRQSARRTVRAAEKYAAELAMVPGFG